MLALSSPKKRVALDGVIAYCVIFVLSIKKSTESLRSHSTLFFDIES